MGVHDGGGNRKVRLLVKDHAELFNQFRATGEHVIITLIPGNHDYDLACYPQFVNRLREYNIVLEPEVSISRELAGKKIWIEHGMQHDESNQMPDFGHPHANPVGYFVTRSIVGTAGRLSGRGRYNWLRDIQSVTPLEGVMNPRRGCRSLAGGRGKRRRQSAAPPKWRAASRNPSLAVETAMPMRNPAPRPSGAVVARSPASPLRT